MFFCNSDIEITNNMYKIARTVICPVCGNYFIEGYSYEPYEQLIDKNKYEEQKALLRYYIKQNTINRSQFDFFYIKYSWVEKILKNKFLPNIAEQVDNLVMYLGNNFNYGKKIRLNAISEIQKQEIISIVGCIDFNNLLFILSSLSDMKLVNTNQTEYNLNIYGWERFNKLTKGNIVSNKAFLAMKFNSKFITEDLINKIKKSLEEIGYQLESLQDRQQAGLIDAHLRQRIKNSKFLIVDLSDANNGAYWEGGYGEGLGKPVIYICDINKFKERSTHFDTNHHLTVMYDKDCTDENNDFHINKFLIKLQDVIKESV